MSILRDLEVSFFLFKWFQHNQKDIWISRIISKINTLQTYKKSSKIMSSKDYIFLFQFPTCIYWPWTIEYEKEKQDKKQSHKKPYSYLEVEDNHAYRTILWNYTFQKQGIPRLTPIYVWRTNGQQMNGNQGIIVKKARIPKIIKKSKGHKFSNIIPCKEKVGENVGVSNKARICVTIWKEIWREKSGLLI
mgnify:CR=1 FL=1